MSDGTLSKRTSLTLVSLGVAIVLVTCLWWQDTAQARALQAGTTCATETEASSAFQAPGGSTSTSPFDQCSFVENKVVDDAKRRMLKSGKTLELSEQHKLLRRLDGEIGSLPAARVAAGGVPAEEAWQHCLPLSARVCNVGTMEMLLRNSPLPPGNGTTDDNGDANGTDDAAGTSSSLPAGTSREAPACASSVLHLLMEEAWAAMRAVGCDAVPLYGSLLGAVRDSAIIQYTWDIDVAYFPTCPVEKLKAALWEKGYLLLDRHRMHSWCIAAHHPLAPYVYDPNKAMVVGPRAKASPYGDLYKILPTDDPEKFKLLDFKKELRKEDIFPLRCERIYNNEYPVMSGAEWFLTEKYGAGYMVEDEDQLVLEMEARGLEVNHAGAEFGTGFKPCTPRRGWSALRDGLNVLTVVSLLLLSLLVFVAGVFSGKHLSERSRG